MTQLTIQGTTHQGNYHELTVDVDAVLFDKDGTLINFGELWIGWFDKLVAATNRYLPSHQHLDTQALYPRVGIYPESRLWDPTGPLTIGSLDDIAIILALSLYESHQLPWNEATQVTQDALADIDQHIDWSAHVTPVKGLLSFIQQASQAGLRLGVVTSDDQRSAQKHIQLLTIDKHFSAVLGHDQVARGKPYPDMVLDACQQLGVQPSRTLIIGDSNGDMVMGQSAGLQAGIGICAAPHLDGKHLLNADCVIRHYGDITVHNCSK